MSLVVNYYTIYKVNHTIPMESTILGDLGNYSEVVRRLIMRRTLRETEAFPGASKRLKKEPKIPPGRSLGGGFFDPFLILLTA